ncbi:MAG: CoA transferase [Proteobacteria bacterium]|nr:CoA transferase [Pseudomonadota bacterium]
MSAGALAGIRVIDITRALTGPFCTMILGDLGADVIKVEIPGRGDEARHWGPPFAGGAGPNYLGFNRNKRSIELDLHKAEGQATVRALAASADVVVENFRPGTMTKFGVGYQTLKALRPGLIYCAISGYGKEGPLANWPAMDLMIQAVSGIMALTGEAAGRPHKAAAPVTDLFGGFSAAIAIMAALRERDRTGEGREIDISMLDCAFTILGQSVSAWGIDGNDPARCTMPEFAHFRGRPELATQASRNAVRITLCAEMETILQTQSADYWLGHFFRLELPAAPVNTIAEIAQHPHVQQRGSLMEIEYPPGSGQRVKIPGMPWRDVAAAGAVRNPPALGEHTREILAECAVALDAEHHAQATQS